ncbi:hypothetical protein HYW55_03365 [Candidatus Gottesmanbacteria bacterium]|nr:hypothetical protein [Candidatus Gottesmanbacteria bacterium]
MGKSSETSRFYERISLLLAMCIFWRFSLFVISWIGSKFFRYSPSFPYSDIFLKPSGLPEFVWTFGNFDGVHYLNIALNGYVAQFTQAFFPFYPLLIRFFYTLLPFPPIVVALIISFVFFTLSVIMFHKLLLLDYGKNTVLWAIGFMILFPTSFYFGSIYNESLFLFLILSSFYFARKKKWALAILFAAISSATRIVAVALLPALLIEWYFQYKRSSWFMTVGKNLFSGANRIRKHIIQFGRPELIFLSIFLSLGGLALYMVYLQKEYGDLLYFWHAQGVFGAERSGSTFILLPQVFYRYFRILTTISPHVEMFWVALIEVVMSLITILFLVTAVLKKVRVSYVVFSTIAFIMPTFTGTLSSMPRYVLVLFPIYIVLALIPSKQLKWLLLYLSSILLTVFTIIFTRGHWLS